MERIAKHTLTMSPDYVLSWGLWEAARELLQNSLDQHTENIASKPMFSYTPETQQLIIGTSNCTLSPKTLLLGMSGKVGNPTTIGEFGEGYKLALLVLTRSSYQVRVRNGGELWVPAFEYSEEFGSSVLTVSRYRDPDPLTGVYFEITHVDEEHFGRITERYLPDCQPNVILDEDHLKGKVFVGGLFVSEIADLRYGYNFSPDRLRLDRDRETLSTFDITYQTSKLWEDHGDVAKVYENIEGGAIDTDFIHLSNPTTNAYVVERYLRESPDAVPVTTNTEAQVMQAAGHIVRIVPQVIRDLLRRMHEFAFNRAGTPTERLERFQHQFGGRLSGEGKREFDAILSASRFWTGPAEELGDQE